MIRRIAAVTLAATAVFGGATSASAADHWEWRKGNTVTKADHWEWRNG